MVVRWWPRRRPRPRSEAPGATLVFSPGSGTARGLGPTVGPMSESTGGPGPTAMSDVLAGTQWEIESIAGDPVLPDVALPIVFGHDGRMSGSTGVNQLTAGYTLNDQY